MSSPDTNFRPDSTADPDALADSWLDRLLGGEAEIASSADAQSDKERVVR